MKIILSNADEISVLGLKDLARMIPADRTGEPLNYGQGEGQFSVDDTVWGFYCSPERFLQYEEGLIAPAELFPMLNAILAAIRQNWGAEIRAFVVGSFSDGTA